MFLHTLALKNFRNHESVRLTFHPKVNLILGQNGIGKTNILEAISLLSTGKSFRSHRLEELVMQGKSYFFVEAEFFKENVRQTLKIGYDKARKKIEYNTSLLSSFSDLLGIIPTVLYTPKDLALIMGSPEERRRFLNILLSQSDPLYVHHLTRYHKALESRNALLKKKETKAEIIECFEEQMSLSALYLMQKREHIIRKIEETTQQLIPKLSSLCEKFFLSYAPSFGQIESLTKDQLCRHYAQNRAKEYLLGSSLYGPHRDDFHILEKKTPVKNFCSEGQKRSLLSALKFSEWHLLHQKHSIEPIMCLDDLNAHLDNSRLSLLKAELCSLGQVFITSTQNSLQLEDAGKAKSFFLKN